MALTSESVSANCSGCVSSASVLAADRDAAVGQRTHRVAALHEAARDGGARVAVGAGNHGDAIRGHQNVIETSEVIDAVAWPR